MTQTETLAPLPERYQLPEAFDVGEYGVELAVCASSLFILIVQDRNELGGGYGVSIITADKEVAVLWEHLDTIEQVENYLAKKAPYKRFASVWVPVPNYSSSRNEIELLKRITRETQP